MNDCNIAANLFVVGRTRQTPVFPRIFGHEAGGIQRYGPLMRRIHSCHLKGTLMRSIQKLVNLVEGYHDAGDNVTLGLLMAFTITMMSWSIVEYGKQMAASCELSNAMEAVKWGTDYLIKAHPQPNVLYGEVFFAKGQEAVDTALKVDLVVLNTIVTRKWLDVVLKEDVPHVLSKVLWWIHEMRVHYFIQFDVLHFPSVHSD